MRAGARAVTLKRGLSARTRLPGSQSAAYNLLKRSNNFPGRARRGEKHVARSFGKPSFVEPATLRDRRLMFKVSEPAGSLPVSRTKPVIESDPPSEEVVLSTKPPQKSAVHETSLHDTEECRRKVVHEACVHGTIRALFKESKMSTIKAKTPESEICLAVSVCSGVPYLS